MKYSPSVKVLRREYLHLHQHDSYSTQDTNGGHWIIDWASNVTKKSITSWSREIHKDRYLMETTMGKRCGEKCKQTTENDCGISAKAAKDMKNALKKMNKEEMKEALKKMNKKQLKAILKVMNPDELKEVLGSMSKDELKAVLTSMNKDELKTVLGNMSKEDLKAVLNSMSKEELQKALENMTEEELKEALKNLSKEEIRALKAAGKLDGIKGIDKLLADSSDEEDSDSDGEGKRKRKKKKKRSDSAYSYYSVTSEGGTRYVRRRHRRPDGTYSDSESCPSDAEAKRAGSGKSKKSKKSVSDKNKKGGGGAAGEKDKKGKKKGGKGEKGGGEGEEGGAGGKGRKGKKGKGGEGGEGGDDGADSDYSIRSEVSEGGTRRQVKMKRIRDEDGNVVGYGEAEPYDYRAESVAGRRGSIESISNREGTLDREERRREMQKLEEQVQRENEEKEKEAIKKKKQEEKEMARLQRKQERERARGSLQGKDLLAGKQGASGDPNNTDGQLMVKGQGEGGKDGDDIPSDFSDDSLDDENVDLSKMTEEEKEAYFADREKRRQLQEQRRRAKYGDKYDEIMKKKRAKKEEEEKAAAEEQTKIQRLEEAQRLASEEERRRRSSIKNVALKTKEKPKSMVTYDKGPPRWPQSKETSNLSRDQPENKHERRNSKVFTSESQNRMSRNGDDFDSKFLKLPPINKNKRGSFSSEDGDTRKRGRRMHPRGEILDKNVAKSIAERTLKENEDAEVFPDDDIIEMDESGKLRLRHGKKLDLSKMSDEMLRKLGIDPNLSNKEKAKLLKKLFGSDIEIQDKGQVIGTKGLEDYDLDEVTDDMLADDPDLDIDTLTGQRRVNVLMRRGGMLLKEHMKNVIEISKLIDEVSYRTDLDEKGDIDFMHHYRLVDPNRIETYAKAFVVEDGDLDTVINLKEMITALDGVPTMNTMTEKQYDYVFKVLNINDATQVTFRMFAVFTALCERVTCMDNLSKHLLEICNLADIERKLDLYRSMFYHNIQSGYDPNHITADSLKIELIAGGLSWLQQQYVMEKMDTDIIGNISFLDYMCYIPLFMSMHDNIVDNPLDMSDQKYSVPPRTRPASAQRDINPLGFPLSKTSSLQMRQKAKDLQEGRLKPSDVAPDTLEKLHKFAKLPDIKPVKRTSTSTTRTSMSSVEKIDLIF